MSKKSKLRHCPVSNSDISSADCGNNRHSAYDCPTDCPHSPYGFDAYTDFLKLEDKVERTALARAGQDPIIGEKIDRAIGSEQFEGIPSTAPINYYLFYHRSQDGSTFYDRWKADGFKDLRNDGVVHLTCKKEIRPALLEIQTIFDEQSFECVDIFDPNRTPFTIYDTSVAARASRFDRTFSLTYKTPGYSRVCGNFIFLNSLFTGEDPQNGFETLIKHLGGEVEPEWMIENFDKICRSIAATTRERKRASLMKTDISSCKIDYELAEFVDTFAQRLEKNDVTQEELTHEEEDEGYIAAYLWLDKSTKDTATNSLGGTPYLGTILIKPGFVRLVASSAKLQAALRKKFEKAAGKKVRFLRELTEDVAAQEATQITDIDANLVSPKLLQNIEGLSTSTNQPPSAQPNDPSLPTSLEGFLENYYRKLLDEPIPQLGNLIPRKAAANSKTRPKVIEWVKGVINNTDAQNLRSGQTVDTSWICKELKLPEIDLPAPPPREPLDDGFEDGFDDILDSEIDDDFEYDSFTDLSNQYEDRLEAGLERYDTAGQAIAAMKAQGFDIIEDFMDFSDALMDEENFNAFVSCLILIWVALVPFNRKKITWNSELSFQIFNELLLEASTLAEKKNGGEDLLELCLEPELLSVILSRYENLDETLPKNQKLSTLAMSQIMIASMAAINITVTILEDNDIDDGLIF